MTSRILLKIVHIHKLKIINRKKCKYVTTLILKKVCIQNFNFLLCKQKNLLIIHKDI